MKTIIPEDAINLGDRMYFFSEKFNGFFYSDFNGEKAKFICSIPNEEINGERLYSSLQCLKNRYICLIPFRAKNLVVYDTIKGIIELVQLPLEITLKDIKFLASIVYNERLYMFGLYISKIYCFDIGKKHCEEVFDWSKLIVADQFFHDRDAFFRQQTVLINNKIIIPFCNANAVLIYDPRKNQCMIKVLKKEKNGYSGILKFKNYLFLAPRRESDYPIIWNYLSDEMEYLSIRCKDCVGIGIVNGTPFFAPAQNYSFMHEYIYYDIERKHIFEDTGHSIKCWSTEFDERDINININEIPANSMLTEKKWIGLDVFLRYLSTESL